MTHEKELLALREVADAAEQMAIEANTRPGGLTGLERTVLDVLTGKLRALREVEP